MEQSSLSVVNGGTPDKWLRTLSSGLKSVFQTVFQSFISKSSRRVIEVTRIQSRGYSVALISELICSARPARLTVFSRKLSE